jgi:hypothetical protein
VKKKFKSNNDDDEVKQPCIGVCGGSGTALLHRSPWSNWGMEKPGWTRTGPLPNLGHPLHNWSNV